LTAEEFIVFKHIRMLLVLMGFDVNKSF